ncbi:hypothetical protein WOSG25_090400 [Weissella oryzae SG25]|uniref:Uncharacterized protein n=1 Tax=Weissella oryzae (strain DSM 25784 / JCM 18191 / LMG 30913 / SG25) TaxID=1329250 RepID=A0A069CVW2_WEIOS|nr:hypothetical protein [Weissella oryzae]GAK31343.1 hypothetical protein WOSG25_090400 [Weissella oryzae SG25]
MIGEQDFMWTTIIGLLTGLGLLIGVFRDSKNIIGGIKDLKIGKKELSADHQKILNKQGKLSSNMQLQTKAIDGLTAKINEDTQRVSMMNATEQNARSSIESLQNFINIAQNDRRHAEDKALEWRSKYAELYKQYELKQQELEQAQELNAELTREINNLRPHQGPTLGGRGR